jgi:DNA-binding response OmpR family regulator
MNIHTNSGPITVLLVDDQPDVLDIHQLFLKKIGCKVITARNGHEAFKIFEQNRDAIDFIVTDYDMPVWDGLKLIRAVRKQNDTVPILMVTGFAGNHSMNEIRNYGVDILQKPVRYITLAAIIKACDHHHFTGRKNHSEQQQPPLGHAA